MSESAICEVCGVGPECSHVDGPEIVPIIWRKDDPMAPYYREIRRFRDMSNKLRASLSEVLEHVQITSRVDHACKECGESEITAKGFQCWFHKAKNLVHRQ